MCTFADDAYLVAAWPGVVTRAGERWLVVVQAAATGLYTVTMAGLPFEYVAAVPDPDATTAAVRNGLLSPLGAQVFAAASPQGLAGILLQEVVPPPPALPTGLAVSASGPAPDTIAATLVSGGDANAAARAYWLDAVKCSLPPCALFACCPEDFTRMHAALAAHWIYTTKPENIGQAGGGANDFAAMRLGPAALTRGQSQWSLAGQAADGDLARTVPGQYFLSLRRKYIFPIVCA